MNPVRITPSRIEDFEACPLRFDLLYVRHAGPVDRKPSSHLSFGISVHDCLYRFHEGGGHKAFRPEAMARLLDRSWVKEGYADDAEQQAYREEAVRICESYYAAMLDGPGRHLGNELFLQGRYCIDGIGVLLSGKLDRLSLWPDGHLEVVDYKTGNGIVPSPSALAVGLSTFLYYALARTNYPQYDCVHVSYIYLRTSTKVVVSYDDKELLAECKGQLRRAVSEIASGFCLPKPNGRCGWCEVRSNCPAMRQEVVDLDRVM